MDSTIKELYTEIFRYKDIDMMFLPDRVRAALSSGLNTNIFLYGPAGTGKSTIARILCEGKETLRLNGSSENGIDVIRNRVVSFATTFSLVGGKEGVKVVYIDEADGLTEAAWDALRETIEHYASHVRFVCTCNKIDKIPMPIKSRFNCIALYPINHEEEEQVIVGYEGLVKAILTKKEIAFTDDDVHAFVKSVFPDMRTILNSLQVIVESGTKTFTRGAVAASFDATDLFNIIMNGGDPVENYKFVMTNYSTTVDDAMCAISKQFVTHLYTVAPELSPKVPYIVIVTGEHMAQLPTAIDKCVVLMSCIFKLQLIIHGQA